MRAVFSWACVGVIAIGVLVFALARPSPGGGKDNKALDQTVRDSLKDVINHGAGLFNKFGDHYGCYRVFDGALRSVRPLLAHHPDLQKAIDEGLESAEAMPSPPQRAFALRRVLDQIRSRLDPSAPPPPKDKTDDKGIVGKTTTTDKKIDVSKDKKTPPKDKKPEEVKLPPGSGRVSGKVTFSTGLPAPSGYLTLIGAGQAKFSAFIKADGTFAFKTPIPRGEYIVTIEPALKDDPLAAKNVPIPAYYRDPLQSPLRVSVAPGANTLDFRLGEPGKK
jgi:hypothetical protein